MSKKSIISAIILLSLIVLSVITFKMSSDMTKEVKISQAENAQAGEKVKVDDLVITETKEGKKYWEIYAKSGQYENTVGKVNLKGVIGNFYKDNKVIMSFMSPTGTYDSKTKAVSLTGGANVATDSNIQINADTISWSGSNEEIHARKNVKINKNNEIQTFSEESIFTTDFSRFKIIGKSKTSVYKQGL